MATEDKKENKFNKNSNYTTIMLSKKLKNQMDIKRRELGLVSYTELIKFLIERNEK
jgi:hypothetical protein